MNRAERQLADLRAARDAARTAFERRFDQAKADLQPTALKQRMVADVKVKAMSLATEAIEIANDSRGVVIGTGAALALWLARRPIGRAATDLWGSWSGNSEPDPGALGVAGKWITDQLAKALVRTSEEKSHDD